MRTHVASVLASFFLLACLPGIAQEQRPKPKGEQQEEDRKKKEEEEEKKRREEEAQQNQRAGAGLSEKLSMGPVYAAPLHEVAQGATVPLRLTKEQCEGRIVLALEKQWSCGPDNLVILGVDMRMTPGLYPVSSEGGPKSELVAALRVSDAGFPRVTRKPPKVRTDPKRRPAERRRIGRALSSGPQNISLARPFSTPLPEQDWQTWPVTDVFGFTRVYARDWVSQHRGQDRGCPRGTPVTSIGNGIVVLAGTFSSEGGLVIIYHGQDIYSLYQHLDSFSVTEGARVAAGQVIAASGNSGNVTGPHLHWAVYINGMVVDPEAFMRTMNTALYADATP